MARQGRWCGVAGGSSRVEIHHEHQMIARLEFKIQSGRLLIARLETSYLNDVSRCARPRGSENSSNMKSTNELERCLRAITEFRREVAETAPDDLDCGKLERELRKRLEAVGCEVMREVLERADTSAPRVTINGTVWGNRRESKGTYVSTFGQVTLPRSIYSQPGGGPVAVALDLRLGIHEGRYTPQMARVLNRAVALMPDEDSEGFLAELGTAMVSKSTLHRVPRAIGARYETRRSQIQEELRESDKVPDAAVTVQASLDGVMVPQDGEYAHARGRPTKTPHSPRHETRYALSPTPGPAANDNTLGRSYHEACVGTVSFWDKDGEHLKTIYMARMPESGKGTLADEVEDELNMALAQRPDLHVEFAADGDPHQWALMEEMALRLPETAIGGVSYMLDFYHAAEYLQFAANAVEGRDCSAARVLAADWREQMKEYEDGPERVLKAMRYYRDRESGVLGKLADLERTIDFLAKQATNGRMGYAAARAANRPIGSGVIEAAAKTVVNTRMKRSGARFSQHGGQTIMIFRTALLSDRFDGLSECLKASYTAIVKAA